VCGSLAERCRVGVPIPRLSGRPRRREALGFVADLGRGRVVGALGGRRLDRVEETVVGDRFVGLVQLAEDRRERRGTVGRGPEPAVDLAGDERTLVVGVPSHVVGLESTAEASGSLAASQRALERVEVGSAAVEREQRGVVGRARLRDPLAARLGAVRLPGVYVLVGPDVRGRAGGFPVPNPQVRVAGLEPANGPRHFTRGATNATTTVSSRAPTCSAVDAFSKAPNTSSGEATGSAASGTISRYCWPAASRTCSSCGPRNAIDCEATPSPAATVSRSSRTCPSYCPVYDHAAPTRGF